MTMLLEMPPYFIWFFTLRHMSYNPELVANFQNVDFFWLTNLSLSDPYMIIPIYSVLV